MNTRTDFSKYQTPYCEVVNLIVETPILVGSGDNGNSLGSLEDNVFGEDFI